LKFPMVNSTTNSYEAMFLLRTAEERIAKHYFDNKIFSFVHFYVGQEAVAVGVSSNLQPQDRVFGNHRSHGHYLAKGGNLFAMYSEMLGKSTGCCRGFGGSMHMLDRSVNFMGTTPILGSVAPIAAGSALQQKMSGESGITTFFIGDGASEEGVFLETLNFAALQNLPLLIVVENNLYSVNSPREARKSPEFDLKTIVEGFGLEYLFADGNDLNDVAEKSANAVASLRLKGKPCVLECRVFRHMAHSAPISDDRIGYRVIDTEEVRIESDSLKNLRNELASIISEEEIRNKERAIVEFVELQLRRAIEAPEPDVSQLRKGVFYDIDEVH
jgi:TPP-dependent pyruvate/acetoin dehydrogenase alpha subunit